MTTELYAMDQDVQTGDAVTFAQVQVDNLRLDGNRLNTVSGNLTLDANTNVISLGLGTQAYNLTNRSNLYLTIQAQNTGVSSFFELYPKDGDGTDSSEFIAYGKGTPGSITNRERLMMGYVKGSSRFEIESEADGSGTLRAIDIYTEGNSGQILVNADGTVDMSGELDLAAGMEVATIQSAAGSTVLTLLNDDVTFADDVTVTGEIEVNGGIDTDTTDLVLAADTITHVTFEDGGQADFATEIEANGGIEADSYQTLTGTSWVSISGNDPTFPDDLIVTDDALISDRLKVGGIGVGTGVAMIEVEQNSSTGAIPVMQLEQYDADAPIWGLIATAATNQTATVSDYGVNDTSPLGPDAAEWTHQYMVKIEINSSTYWVPVYSAAP